jgi:hypothetical protein
MISLCAPEYDLVGSLRIGVRLQDAHQARRRGSVVATLDGESVVYDAGYALSDTTLSAEMKRPPLRVITALNYLVAYYAELIVSCETVCFIARAEYVVRRDTLVLQLRLLRRLD